MDLLTVRKLVRRCRTAPRHIMLMAWCLALPEYAIASLPTPFDVRAGNLVITLSPLGQITSVKVKGQRIRVITGQTELDTCVPAGPVTPRSLRGGSVQFTHTVAGPSSHQACRITERFAPDGRAIRWEVTVEGDIEPWSTGISTVLQFDDTTQSRFWTAWGSPGHLTPADWGGEGTEWHDPFRTRPFRDMHLVYGGHFGKGAGFALPVFSVMDTRGGFALAISPEDPLLELHMFTTRAGEVKMVRRFNRLEKGRPVKFTMYLFSHEPDWRSVAAFMVERFPRFFKPPATNVMEISGLGAYSSYEGDLDIRKYSAMGGIVNWKASFDFSYMGMFIPPVATDTTRWQRFDVTSEGQPIPGKVTFSSIRHLREYAASMKAKGFFTLNYFNVTEFGGSSQYGSKIDYPRPNFRPGEDGWTNPSAVLYTRFPGALLFGALDHVGWHMRTPQQHMNSPVRFHEEPFWTWGGAVATDVGDSAYADFLLEQAQRHIDKIPDAQGICMDRMDWLNEFNWKADDGRSWLAGRPARSLLNSFKGFIPRLSAILHQNGKVMFCNPHMNRLELMEQFDGVYNEFGHIGHNLNLSAFLCFFKPLLCWTPDKATVMKDPDHYFQHHLLMGAFPTAPFPGNDHTIQPDPDVERYYLDYGKMFVLLHGRTWVLLPGVVETVAGTALCNVFRKGKDALVIPVMMGAGDSARVRLRHWKQLLGGSAASGEVWHPGVDGHQTLVAQVHGDSLDLPVSLRRGCAFLVLTSRPHH